MQTEIPKQQENPLDKKRENKFPSDRKQSSPPQTLDELINSRDSHRSRTPRKDSHRSQHYQKERKHSYSHYTNAQKDKRRSMRDQYDDDEGSDFREKKKKSWQHRKSDDQYPIQSSKPQEQEQGQEEQLQKLQNEVEFFLKEDHPRQKYSRTIDWDKKKDVIHWGQRKLFISELLFLTRYGHLADLIVYAGGAPGTHSGFMSELFPDKNFVLIDPSPFSMKKAYPNVELINEYFTEELAARYSDKPHLFISDIRTADSKSQDKELVEKMVKLDSKAQEKWIEIMKPKKSLLKFRCPYPDREEGKQPFFAFKGDIYIQGINIFELFQMVTIAWCAPTSTETRLIPHDSLEIVEYDSIKYEEQLYHFNHNTRVKQDYSQPVKGEGLKRNWDCSAEVLIIAEFFKKYPQCMAFPQDMFKSIAEFSHKLSVECTMFKRTLLTPMVDPTMRRQFAARDHTSFHKELTAEQKQLQEEEDRNAE